MSQPLNIHIIVVIIPSTPGEGEGAGAEIITVVTLVEGPITTELISREIKIVRMITKKIKIIIRIIEEEAIQGVVARAAPTAVVQVAVATPRMSNRI